MLGSSVANRHLEVPFIFSKTATQKNQKGRKYQKMMLFSLERFFQKHPEVSTYIAKEHLDVKKKASQHFEKLVTLLRTVFSDFEDERKELTHFVPTVKRFFHISKVKVFVHY